MKRLILLFSLILSCLFCQTSAVSAQSLRSQINAVLQSPSLRSAQVGIRIELLDSHKEVFSHNASIPMIPASNLKLLTSASALLKLGPDYRFVTSVLGHQVNAKRLHGNLILRGTGDPTWSKAFYPSSITPLIILAQRLKESGLEEVDGDLVVDDSAFDRQFTGQGWKSRYEWEEYAAEAGALSLNNNQVKISVFPSSQIGARGQVVLWPDNHLLTVVNHTWTSRSGTAIDYHRNRMENLVVVSGPIGHYRSGISFLFNVHNPPMFVGSAFGQILKREGIRINGKVRLIHGKEIGGIALFPVLTELRSPPLSVIVRRLNKESDNFIAEHLFRFLGYKCFGKGTIANSTAAVSKCLAELGIPRGGLQMADGSGLSEENRVSPMTLVELLEGMSTRSIGGDFAKSLPQGCMDGTLEDRFCGLQGAIEAKTGAIQGAVSLSGYLMTSQGRTVAFSIILNHLSVSSETARNTIDKIIRLVAKSRDLS